MLNAIHEDHGESECKPLSRMIGVNCYFYLFLKLIHIEQILEGLYKHMTWTIYLGMCLYMYRHPDLHR